MKLLHLADVHLGASYSGFGDLGAERRRQVLDAFRRLPDVASDERVDAVLVAGDLFDGPRPDSATLAAARDVLRRFVDACIPVFMVPGNHDALTLRFNPYRDLARGSRVVMQRDGEDVRRDWPLDDELGRRLAEKHSVYILARTRFGTPVTVETDDGPLHVYGIGYDAADCRDPVRTFRRSDAAGVHVVLLHGSVHDAEHWEGSGSSLVLGPDDLEALGADYIALGDHHRPKPPEEFGGPPACYPGSFAATDLTEAGPRGYVMVDVESGEPPSVEHRECGVAPVAAVELDVSGLGDEVAAAEAISRELPPDAVPVVRLVGEPAFPLDPEVILADLVERYGHASVRDDTRFYDSVRLDELAKEDTVAGHVVRLGRRRVEAAQDDREREVARRALRVALRALEVE